MLFVIPWDDFLLNIHLIYLGNLDFRLFKYFYYPWNSYSDQSFSTEEISTFMLQMVLRIFDFVDENFYSKRKIFVRPVETINTTYKSFNYSNMHFSSRLFARSVSKIDDSRKPQDFQVEKHLCRFHLEIHKNANFRSNVLFHKLWFPVEHGCIFCRTTH